jgi:hypothetical protein
LDIFSRGRRVTGEVPNQARSSHGGKDLRLPHCMIVLPELLGDGDSKEWIDDG